jgi:hypothetical protein
MSDPNSAATWAVAGSAITFALTVILVACHLIPVASTLVVGTRIEGAVIFVLACFWAAIVAIVTNASNALGVSDDSSNQVKNGNLYYFSYVCAYERSTRRAAFDALSHACCFLFLVRFPSCAFDLQVGRILHEHCLADQLPQVELRVGRGRL